MLSLIGKGNPAFAEFPCGIHANYSDLLVKSTVYSSSHQLSMYDG